jgi:hypothetical protein
MNIGTVVFDSGGLSGHDEMMMLATARSVGLAGQECSRAIIKNSLQASFQGDPDFCHYMWPGTIVLPQFYDALVAACQHNQTDYAYCHCARVRPDAEIITSPSPDSYALSQILVRSWVMLELGTQGNPAEMIRRVMSEYRGTEVPHVLTMEIYP